MNTDEHAVRYIARMLDPKINKKVPHPYTSGYWLVRGEPENANAPVWRDGPVLGVIEGTYKEALEMAVAMPCFFTWGGGGELTSIELHQTPSVLNPNALDEATQKKIHEQYNKDNYIETELKRERFDPDTEGHWAIYSEPENVDMFSHDQGRLLGYFAGTYLDALKKAVDHKSFFTWGGGGRVESVPMI